MCAKRTIKKFDQIKVVLPMKCTCLCCTMVTLRSETLLYINTSYHFRYAILPKTAALMKKHPIQRRLRHAEQLQQHTFVVKPPFCEQRSAGLLQGWKWFLIVLAHHPFTDHSELFSYWVPVVSWRKWSDRGQRWIDIEQSILIILLHRRAGVGTCFLRAAPTFIRIGFGSMANAWLLGDDSYVPFHLPASRRLPLRWPILDADGHEKAIQHVSLRYNALWATTGKNRINSHLIIHFPTSKGARERVRWSARANQVVRRKRMSEQCKWMDERMAQFLNLGFWLIWPTVQWR